ncbi:hypothetical protein HDU96_005789 [Phlyctochytrium bullatum]|nr:hypothetical protein HDU96_005789 [Phlyctochytrium bullatum]
MSERLGDAQEAIKAKYGIIEAAAYIRLYDKQRQKVKDLDDIPDDYFKKRKSGGLSIEVRTLPPATRESRVDDLVGVEVKRCQGLCYPNLSMQTLEEKYQIFGGVARFVFDTNTETSIMETMEKTLADADAVKAVRCIGLTTSAFENSHTLLHLIVSNKYQFLNVDIASKYVGEQLWIRHAAQMMTNLQDMIGCSPPEIARHLFEIYGHLVFSAGGRTLKCRCLESGTVTQMKLDSLNSQRVTFGKDSIPTAEDLQGKYYEPTDDPNFPAIDSLSSQGMFQFTVKQDHAIAGAKILKKLCKLYVEPKLYFVVPPHRFKAFKKQSFKSSKGIPHLKQYVLELSAKE